METLQSFTSKFAKKLSEQQPDNSTLAWDFRGEVGEPTMYDRTMIGIV